MYVCVTFLSLFELSFVITTTVLTLASCYYITFNYDSKKVRDVDRTCRCPRLYSAWLFVCWYCPFFCLFVHLFFFFFLQGVVSTFFPRLEEVNAVFCHCNTIGFGKTLTCSRIRQVGLISFGWGSNSRICLWIPESEFHLNGLLFSYVVLNQKCCLSFQYNLLDRMLRNYSCATLSSSFDTSLPW